MRSSAVYSRSLLQQDAWHVREIGTYSESSLSNVSETASFSTYTRWFLCFFLRKAQREGMDS